MPPEPRGQALRALRDTWAEPGSSQWLLLETHLWSWTRASLGLAQNLCPWSAGARLHSCPPGSGEWRAPSVCCRKGLSPVPRTIPHDCGQHSGAGSQEAGSWSVAGHVWATRALQPYPGTM